MLRLIPITAVIAANVRWPMTWPEAAVGINRVVYDVTSKPPGTIEWE